ncbi:hypothetical protein [Streptomyces achmelvichensis]|uniref:hypothetical protein n=1 Tax=Streptomyces achmelvichensis TaxID=3134111 RepID=UPI003C12B9C4
MLVYPSAVDLFSRTLRHLSGDTYARLAAGFRIGIATAYHYIREAIDLLAALAPTLEQAMATVRRRRT